MERKVSGPHRVSLVVEISSRYGIPLLVWRHIFMNYFSRILFTIGLGASITLGMYPFFDTAGAAFSPSDVSTLPAITAEISTPVRLAKDSAGNLYVTNPSAGGVLKYDSAGTLIKKITTSKNGTGVAIAQNGDLLVTQGTYVSVIDPASGSEKSSFGTFTYANGIAVDPSGNIYVSDGRANTIKKYNASGTLLATSSSASLPLLRPAGLAYEKASGRLAVANSLYGNVQFVDPATLTMISTLGEFGYDPSNASVKFSYPQGISFEYDAGGALYRIYVSDSYQSAVQVIDGATMVKLGEIGGYGFSAGRLFAPSDVLFDQSTISNKRVFVANGGGNVSVFGIDNMQPTFIQVRNTTPESLDSQTLTWVNPTTPNFSYVRIYSSNAAGQPLSLLADNLTGTTFPVSGLNQGTTYYYLVRAVDTVPTEYANTQPVSAKTRINYPLALASYINGVPDADGSNAIRSSDYPLAAAGGASTNPNSVNILDNTVVTLTAVPDSTSVFTKWTGDCAAFADSDVCQITMNSTKNVTANFEAEWPFLVDDTWFLTTLQDAYDTALGNGSKIQAMTGVWPASIINLMLADRSISTTVEGGYDSSFADPAPLTATVIKGRVNLRSGKTIMKNIKIRP